MFASLDDIMVDPVDLDYQSKPILTPQNGVRYVPEPYQLEMSRFMLQHPSAAILAGMGLGKTAATLHAILTRVRNGEGGALVIAPLKVSLITWPSEILYWKQFSGLRFALLRTKEGKKAWMEGTADVYIMNWDYIPSFVRHCLTKGNRKNLPATTVVYDELSKAKSHSSRRVNEWRRYRHLFPYHIGLTGTPSPNSYADLFAQYRLLDGGVTLGTAFGAFQNEYFTQMDWNGYKWDLKPGAKELIEQKIAPMTLVMKREDFLKIPPTYTHDIEVPLPPSVTKVYHELEKELLVKLDDGKILDAANAAVLIGKLTQVTSGTIYNAQREVVRIHKEKINALHRLVNEIGEPVIVATHFKHERARILKLFGNAAVPFSDTAVADWNAGKIRMLIVDPRSVGHGINLQHGGRTVIWFSLSHSSEQHDQLNARVARKGQENETHIYRLVSPMTVDDVIVDVLSRKGNQQNSLLNAVRGIRNLAKATT